jgi:hypothetical protein
LDRGSQCRPGVIVLITEVSGDHVRALMCSNERDVATETDAELAPGSLGAPYRLLAQGRRSSRSRICGGTRRLRG